MWTGFFFFSKLDFVRNKKFKKNRVGEEANECDGPVLERWKVVFNFFLLRARSRTGDDPRASAYESHRAAMRSNLITISIKRSRIVKSKTDERTRKKKKLTFFFFFFHNKLEAKHDN